MISSSSFVYIASIGGCTLILATTMQSACPPLQISSDNHKACRRLSITATRSAAARDTGVGSNAGSSTLDSRGTMVCWGLTTVGLHLEYYAYGKWDLVKTTARLRQVGASFALPYI
jgi:hypothetical protein